MPITFVNDLENKLSVLQDKISNDAIYAYLHQNDVVNLLEEAKRLKIYFTSLKVNEEIISELTSLINRIKQFYEDVLDIIELRRNSCL